MRTAGFRFETVRLSEVTGKLSLDSTPKTVEKVTWKEEPYTLKVQDGGAKQRIAPSRTTRRWTCIRRSKQGCGPDQERSVARHCVKGRMH